MESIIKEMIWSAWRHNDREMAVQAYKIMCELAKTVNCPSNWRDIGERMAEEFKNNEWVIENCCLYDF